MLGSDTDHPLGQQWDPPGEEGLWVRMQAPLGPRSTSFQTLGTQALWSLHTPALSPALWFPQKYTEEVLSAADPSQPPPPPLQHFLEQPVERVQQYQALLKVGSTAQGLWGRPRAQPPQALP